MTAPNLAARRLDPNYKWIALSNTTLGILMAAIDGSIVIIALPAIFNGIQLDPLEPGSTAYLLWIFMGYLLVTAVLVVAFGWLGDRYGRVRMYTGGFLIFTIGSILLAFTPFMGTAGALWIIAMRIVQGIGGAFLFANSAAILTDAFPPTQRGLALGINGVAAIAGQFIGLLLGGFLATINWRLVFFVSVPIGIVGTIWAYLRLEELSTTTKRRMDWWGNLTFAFGLSMILIGITYGIQPYGDQPMGWTSPMVIGLIGGGILLLVLFVWIEQHVIEPFFDLSLFRIRAFAAGNIASLLASTARGGLSFIIVIWLQGIWLPVHGYSYADTPLWAGIFMLPLTVGFLIAGPLSGFLSDRFGARLFATGGMILAALAFIGLTAQPVQFSYPTLAFFLLLAGLRIRAVQLAQRGGDHEQRAGQPARCSVGHAGRLRQCRFRRVDWPVLLADDRRPGRLAPGDPLCRADRPRCAGRRRDQDLAAAAGIELVRVAPRLQPDGVIAAPGRAQGAAAGPGGDPDRQGFLPQPDQRPLPRRPGDRVPRRRRHVGGRGDRLEPAWRQIRPRRPSGHRTGPRDALTTQGFQSARPNSHDRSLQRRCNASGPRCWPAMGLRR